MSYHKKSLILQELEQAIRKKAQEKSRHKQQFGRNLQTSIDKKKHLMRTATNKDHKAGSITKNDVHQRSDKVIQKHISLFSNEQLNSGDSQEFKFKKHNNRKFDKLISLVQYMVSSSEKAIKYISSTNFEAEFALKLYRSDKENLMNEIKNFNLQEFMESLSQSEPSKVDPEYGLLLQENNKLKKDILILQKEAERYHNKIAGNQDGNKFGQLENKKLKDIIRKIVPFDSFKQLMDMVDKENKFQNMAIKCQENSRKFAEIQIVMTSLEAERNQLIQNLHKQKNEIKTDRSAKIGEIQNQKEQLQKEIHVLKTKIIQLKESSQAIAEYDILKKNSELIYDKLNSFAIQITGSISPSKRKSNQLLLQLIKSKYCDLSDRNEELQTANSKLKVRLEEVKFENQELLEQKEEKEQQVSNFEQRMKKMIGQLENMRIGLDQLTTERDEVVEKNSWYEGQLRKREEQMEQLKEAILGYQTSVVEQQKLKAECLELKDSHSKLSKKLEDKDRYYKQKLLQTQSKVNNLQEELTVAMNQLQFQKDQMTDILNTKQIESDEVQLTIQTLKIEVSKKQAEAQEVIKDLEDKLEQSKAKYEKLCNNFESSNEYYQTLTEEFNSKHQKINELQTYIEQLQEKINQLTKQNEQMDLSRKRYGDKVVEKEAELFQDNNSLKEELKRVSKENESLNERLRINQQELIKNCYNSEELQAVKTQNTSLQKGIKKLENQIESKKQIIIQKDREIKERSDNNLVLQTELKQLKQYIQEVQEDKQQNHLKVNQNSAKQKKQIQKFLLKLQEIQKEKDSLQIEKNLIQQALDGEKVKNNVLEQDIKLLQKEIQELKSEVKSLNSLSNNMVDDRQNFKQKILQFEQQISFLKNQLASKEQQIIDQSQITGFKAKQYSYLVKQILKGLLIDPQNFQHIDNFQELLQFGSQQVLAMRKRLRDQESNRRRNKERYSSQRENSPELEEVKVQLFEDEKGSSPQKENKVQQEEMQIGEFEQMKQEEVNSVVSEDNAANLEDFKDISQKVNDSMISKDDDPVQQQANNKSKDEEGEEAHNISDFKDMRESQVNDSMISVEAEKPGPLQVQEKTNPNEDQINEEIIRSGESSKEQQLEMIYKPKIIQDVSEMKEMQGDFFKIGSQNTIKNRQSLKKQEWNNNSFEDFSHFLTGQKSNQSAKNEKRSELDEEKNLSQVQEGKIQTNSQFAEDMSSSLKMKESKQSVSQSGAQFDDFNNLQTLEANQSMMSQKAEDLLEVKENQQNLKGKVEPVSTEQNYDIDNFGEVKNEVNESLLSEKEHGMSEFDDLNEHQNESIVSEEDKNKHEFFQFGQLSENVNSSIISETNQKNKQEEKGEDMNLSDFAQLGNNQMNSSIISNTDSKE